MSPELGLMSNVPFDDGSGKFGTPCVRMHSENLNRADEALAAALDFDDDPHPARTSAATAELSAIAQKRGPQGETMAWVLGGRR